MKTAFATILLLSTCLHLFPEIQKTELICFERRGAVWLANIDGSNQRAVISSAVIKKWQGLDFRIAPDGSNISFTTVVGEAGTDRYRAIAIFNLSSKSVALLDNVPKMNNYNAVWSHDASFLAFTFPHKASPGGVSLGVSIIRRDNTAYATISDRLGPKEYTVYSYCWSPDSKSILCLSSDSLYQLTTGGSNLHTESFITPYSDTLDVILSTSTVMSASPNGRLIALDSEVYDDGRVHFKNYWHDALYGAVWLYDREIRKFTRLTPKNISASNPAWTKLGDAILFSGIPGDNPRKIVSNIYRMDASGRNIRLIISDATNPTIATE
jgi:Tol biopolymer transport system component